MKFPLNHEDVQRMDVIWTLWTSQAFLVQTLYPPTVKADFCMNAMKAAPT